MRIAFVNHYARVMGGADRHCIDLAEALRRRGHDVAFLSTAGDANEEQAGVFVPLRVSRVSKQSAGVLEQIDIARRALWNPDGASAMRTLMRSFQPDVVHAHKLYPQLSVAPLVVARREGVPVVQTVHDYEFVSANWRDHTGGRLDHLEARRRDRCLNTVTRVVRRSVHRRAVDRWVTVSRFVAEVLRLHGIRSDVLPNSTNRVPARVPGFDERSGVAFAGTLSQEKGVLDVLELARLLPDLSVTVAGAGPLAEAVAQASLSLPNLRFAGRLDQREMHALLSGARIVVMPSRWEDPGPLLALEAMAQGTPVIAYPRGGLAEYISDSHAGVVVREEPQALASASASLCGDTERWNALSSAGRHAVTTSHSAREYAKRIESIYFEVQVR